MLKRILPLLLLLTPWAWGQDVVTTPMAQDITSYCTSGTDCFVPMPSADCSHGIRIGGDEFLACLNSSGTVLKYNPGTKSWAATSWTGEYGLAVQDANDVYVLRPNSQYCTAPNYGVYSLNTSTGAYTFANGCGTILNVAGDGTLVIINSSAQAYYTLNPANGWTQLPFPGIWGWIAAANQFLVVAVRTDHTVWQCNPANCTWAQLGTLSNAIDITASYAGDVSVIGSDSKLHHWNGSSWATASGSTISAIAEASVGLIYAGIGGQPYHWNIIGGGFSAHLGGNVNGCPPPNGCTPTTEHTGSIDLGMGEGIGSGVVTGETSPENGMNLTSTGFSGQCDFGFSGPNDPSCKPTLSASIFCPIAAAYLFTDTSATVGCQVPLKKGSSGWWGAGKTITVYFDGNFFTQGGNCPNTSDPICDFMQGVYGWDHLTTNNNTFTYGGILPPSKVCTNTYGFQAPCNMTPSFPYVMVTDGSKFGSCGSACVNGPINFPIPGTSTLTQGAYVGIATVGFYEQNAGKYVNALEYFGAHEIGHTFGLYNCDDPNDPLSQNCYQDGGVPQTSGTTVMWYAPDGHGTNETNPAGCDKQWANIAQQKYGH